MIGGGCSCGLGGVVVALEDFEQDIADYLQAEAQRHDRQDVLSYMETQGREKELWSIARLLVGLTKPSQEYDPSAGGFVLERLGRTLNSFEKLHASR
jgi:hypothetical protein